MAFPVIASTSTGSIASNSASTTITLPSGCQVGHTAILIFTKDGSAAPTSSPANSQVIAQSADSGNASHISIWKFPVAYLSDFTISHASEMSSWICLSFAGGIDFQVSSVARGSSNVPNPPSLTHSFGAGTEVMWLALMGHDYNRTTSAYPSTFTDNRINSRSTATGGTGTSIATLNSTTNPQDPGTFTISSSDTWCAYTLALKVHIPTEKSFVNTLAVTTDTQIRRVGIHIWRRDGEVGEFVRIVELDPNITTYADSYNLVNGTTYYYQADILKDGTYHSETPIVSVLYESAGSHTPIRINVGGVWKSISSVSVNIGGVWKVAESVKVNIGGTWKSLPA